MGEKKHNELYILIVYEKWIPQDSPRPSNSSKNIKFHQIPCNMIYNH